MSVFWETIASNALLVTILAAILIVLGRFWKHPASLHLLWVMVLLKLFIPPVYTIGLPASTSSETAPKPTESVPITAETVASGETASNAANAELPWSVTPPDAAADTSRTLVVPTIEQVATEPAPIAEVQAARAWSLPGWSSLLICGWGSGTVLLAIGCWRRVRAFRRLLRSAEAPTDELRETAERIGKRLGLRRVPEISVVSVRLSPMVWALYGRALVVLPKNLIEQLGGTGREAILAHELAHVRRRDHLVRWVELLAIVVFWWHPVVWWARRELRELEEQCCDGVVLDVLPDASRSYAESLVETLDFLSETSFIKPLAATGAKPGVSLARRIAMLKNHRSAGVRLTVGRALLLLAVAAVPMALALASEPPQPVESSGAGPAAAVPISSGLGATEHAAATDAVPAPPATELAPPASGAGPRSSRSTSKGRALPVPAYLKTPVSRPASATPPMGLPDPTTDTPKDGEEAKTRINELLVERRDTLRERVDALRAVIWRTGVADVGGNHVGLYLSALDRLCEAELDLCNTPAERIAVRTATLEPRKRVEDITRAKYEAHVEGGTIQAYTTAKADRLRAEIDLLRERIRHDHWSPATNRPMIDPPGKTISERQP